MESNSNVLGVVLTKFDPKKAGYGYGYSYYQYGRRGAAAYSDRSLSEENRMRRRIKLFEAEEDDGATVIHDDGPGRRDDSVG
jgi:hypothetical protein